MNLNTDDRAFTSASDPDSPSFEAEAVNVTPDPDPDPEMGSETIRAMAMDSFILRCFFCVVCENEAEANSTIQAAGGASMHILQAGRETLSARNSDFLSARNSLRRNIRRN